ncbi:hypothetical protein Tco_1477324, partial [Tanacetum coccineum]
LELAMKCWNGAMKATARKGGQGGDEATCKLLGCFLGDVIEVLEVFGFLLRSKNGRKRDSSDKHFFRLEMWKVLWTLLSSSGSSSLYATGPIRLRILNGPMYRGLSFPHFPNWMIPLRDLLESASVVKFALFSRWFPGLFLALKILPMFWDDMPYSCLIEYLKHSAKISRT